MTSILMPGRLALIPLSQERLALIRVEDEVQEYDLSLLLVRVAGPRWVVADPEGVLSIDDLSVEEVVPLVSGQPYPDVGRPFLIREPLDETWVAGLKARARSLAELHGAPSAPTDLVGSVTATWLYADPAHPSFDREIDVGAASVSGGFRVENAAALVRDTSATGAVSWTYGERVAALDRESWRREKREGAGRDPRLTPLKETKWGSQALYRDVVEHFEKVPTPMEGLFEGPSCATELSNSIATSGLEPLAFTEHFITTVGVGARSSVAIELRAHIFTLMLLGTVDRLNIPRLAAGEHISRRCLQLMKAAKLSPKGPDFENLELYLPHMGPVGGTSLRTPTFDKFITEV